MKSNIISKGDILIVDDEPNTLKVLSAILSGEGYSVHKSPDCDEAIRMLSRLDIDAVITDLKMPGKSGAELFDHIRQNHSGIPVIFMTAYGTVESAVQAIMDGAFYYFLKPPDFLKLKEVVDRAVEKRQKNSNENRPAPIKRYHVTDKSNAMAKVTQIIESVKDGSSSVLITGETGAGKKLAAMALHYGGKRKDHPFIDINCSAIPQELLAYELFGYEKDTGAHSKRTGKFEEAGSGTLFLDEVGGLGMPLQTRLLRVLQEMEHDMKMERSGGNKNIKTGFRLIVSTNRDLSAQVKKGSFREDLYYRINVVQINIPPLRERMDDLPFLAMQFLNEFSQREDRKKLFISGDALNALNRYSWPGNVRQLRNVIERAVVLARHESITANDLPSELIAAPAKKRHGLAGQLKTLKELEVLAIRKALSKFEGNKSRAARALGISRKAFYKKLTGAVEK